MRLFSCKSAFWTQRIARLSLVKRAVSVSWLRDWWIFCLYTIFGNKFGNKFACKSDYLIKVNPSGFSYEKPLPFTKGRLCCGFLWLLFVAEIWCKQVVYVQTYGLHRRSMNAPTMPIYKYIYLWPTKINHGYTVGATIGRLISNYLNCFSAIKYQLKQAANSPSLCKGGCQR